MNGPLAGHPGKSTRRNRRKREPCDRTAGRQPAVRLVANCLISTRLSAIGKSKVTESQFVTWVGATCALLAPPVSCLGEFHLSAQWLHLSAQRQSAGLPRSARESGLKGAAVVGASQRSGRCSVRRSAELGPTLTILSGLRVFATWPRKRWRFARDPSVPKPDGVFGTPGSAPRIRTVN